jgi:hypothetical protein
VYDERWRERAGGYEKKVIHSTKSRRGVKKAGEIKHSKAEAHKKEIIAAVRKRLSDSPKDSVDYAKRRVADEHSDDDGASLPGWSYGTICRATRGMKRPPTNRRTKKKQS